MTIEMLKYVIIGIIALIVIIGIAYVILMKKMGKSEYRQMKKLQEGTKAESFSSDIFYQKLYIKLIINAKIPHMKKPAALPSDELY